MNNDFNYKPSQPKPQAKPGEPEETSEASESQEQSAAPAPRVITSDRRGGGFKKFLSFLGVLVLIAAAAGGVYYWQHHKVLSLRATNSDLSAKVSALEAANAKKGALPATNDMAVNLPADTKDIITESPTNITATSATVGVMFSPAVTQVWIESGTSPDKLSDTKPKVTPIKAATDVVDVLDGLKPQSTYFYRGVGTVDGKTVYGGIVSFNTAR